MHALLMAMRGLLGLSGTLSTADTTATVTSATRTIRGSGLLLFDTLAGSGSGLSYSLNGGGFTSITEGLTLSVGPNQTIAVRVGSLSVGQSATFNLKRNAGGSLIEAVTLQRV